MDIVKFERCMSVASRLQGAPVNKDYGRSLDMAAEVERRTFNGAKTAEELSAAMSAFPEAATIGLIYASMSEAKADTVKLSYFPLKARCFPALLALEVGGVDYQAEVVQFADWGGMKASGVCPFGYLPLLTLADGTTVNETNAVLMTVGQLAGLNGEGASEFGVSSMLACKSAEVFTEFAGKQPTMFSVEGWNQEKAAALAEWKEKCQSSYLSMFDKLCSAEGKFSSSGTTVGELHLFSLLFHMQACGCFPIDSLPDNLQAFYRRLRALPAVARCCEGGTPMGQQADYVVPVPE